jgi:hypothetical protein
VLRIVSSVCVALAIAACGTAVAQADFSADIANLSATTNTFHTKIFSTKDKLRFQGEDKSGRTNSIMIVNLEKRTSIVLIPQQKQYAESKRPQIPGQGVTFFQAKDVEDACDDWRAVALTEKGKCKKVGHETANGRDAVKYEVTPGQGSAGAMWIDVKLHFPVKWQNAVESGELRNIQEGPQAAELFQIPSGYVKRTYGSPGKSKAAKP